MENGKLILPIQKNDVKTTGSVGTVTVVIKSTNYEDITLTVNVNATNKLVPHCYGTYGKRPDLQRCRTGSGYSRQDHWRHNALPAWRF